MQNIRVLSQHRIISSHRGPQQGEKAWKTKIYFMIFLWNLYLGKQLRLFNNTRENRENPAEIPALPHSTHLPYMMCNLLLQARKETKKILLWLHIAFSVDRRSRKKVSPAFINPFLSHILCGLNNSSKESRKVWAKRWNIKFEWTWIE